MKGDLDFRCGYAKDAIGGEGGLFIYPYDIETLIDACELPEPAVIKLDPMTDYNLDGQKLYVEGRKTIIGGVGTTIKNGELRIQGVKDVVIYHIRFRDPVGDCITVRNSDLVHIHQCTFDQGTSGTVKHGGKADGAVDIVGWTGTTNSRVTVAKCRFWNYHKCHLIGYSQPEYNDNLLRVTLYRNWYRYKCNRRMPQVNRAWVHMRNCFIQWNDQCAASYVKGRVYMDRCYIESMEDRPYCGEYKRSGKPSGYISFGGGCQYKDCKPVYNGKTAAKQAKAHWDTMPRLSKSWSSAKKVKDWSGMQYR